MDWFFQALGWYLILLVLGVIFFPLTRKIFSSFFDQGYVFSKTIAILLLSYASFLLGILHILPFTQLSLITLIVVATGLTVFLSGKKSFSVFKIERSLLSIIVFEEMLFIGAFFFLTIVRGQEPGVRGLEKFMDFGFMQSILRGDYFPPLDMWYSGFPINYYYFGHLTGSLLIKLSGIKPAIGYNLILATIFGQGITLAFSLCGNLTYLFQKHLKEKGERLLKIGFFGLLGSFIINLGGNLHTMYLFTKGYPNEKPVPLWEILSGFNPVKYWYPNATRFIPFTIHEFPSYSYVVADLHGHVFDIPFVLLTLALLLVFFVRRKRIYSWVFNFPFSVFKEIPTSRFLVPDALVLGFMTAVHYMTNAFDGPIYVLLALILFLIVDGLTTVFLVNASLLLLFFFLFSLPFSVNFLPFISGIGVNCSPAFLRQLGELGPFLFEQKNCQASPVWMLFILWGFFIISFLLLLFVKKVSAAAKEKKNPFDTFALVLFSFGLFLIIIPEFFYIKDIYPLHFRANTMFKLGYQAFIMMGAASAYAFYRVSRIKKPFNYVGKAIFLFFFFFVFLYPFFSFPSYYGKLDKEPQLDGERWMEEEFPEDKEIVDYLNTHIRKQPLVLEAQGDSYTDYNRISAYTGLPTVAGWWVHEWLWRGSSDAVGARAPEVQAIYESPDINLTLLLLKKYQIGYIVVSHFEKEKYKKLNEDKFFRIGRKIFQSTNKKGAIYQVNLD